MKIKSIDIAAFGRFKNYHLSFDDGFSIVYGENENGKTTIMSFIRMMFYGNTGKTKEIEKNPRHKYRPWNSDFMAGSIEFEHEGKNYCLEREFKNTNSADKITLLDLDTGKATVLSGSTNIGAKFFSLSDAAFERSVFLGEAGAPSKNEDAHGELNARLSNLAGSGEEDVSYEKVKARLISSKETLFSKSGRIGLADKASARLVALKGELRESELKEAEVAALESQLAEKQAEYTAEYEEKNRLFELMKNADKIKRARFVRKYVEAQTQADRMKAGFIMKNGDVADSSFAAKAGTLLSALGKAQEKYKELSDERDRVAKDIENLETSTTEQPEQISPEKVAELDAKIASLDNDMLSVKEKSAKVEKELGELAPTHKFNPLLLIIGIVVAVVGGVSFAIMKPFIAGAVLGVGALLIIVGCFMKKTIAPDDTYHKNELSRLSVKLNALLEAKQTVIAQKTDMVRRMNDYALKNAGGTALLAEKKERCERLTAEANEWGVKLGTAREEYLTHVSQMRDVADIEQAQALIDQLLFNLREYEVMQSKLSVIRDNAGCENIEQAKEKLARFEEMNALCDAAELENIQERFNGQSEAVLKIKTRIAEIKSDIKAITDSTESAAVIERKIAQTQDTIASYNAYAQTVDTALATLEESFRELRRNYSGELDSKTAEIFSALTMERYTGVAISKDFDINVKSEEVFGLKEAGFLSTGTADQLYLSLRLAMSELICADSEPLPMFMDDPLAQYDDERTKKALAFMGEYGKRRQLVLFTCHSSIIEAAKEINTEFKEIRL